MKRLAILGCALVLSLPACGRASKHCAVCERSECSGLAFRVTPADGKRVETCCPRCGLRYLQSSGQAAQSLQATDFKSGRWIKAAQAVYVSGSDQSHCTPSEARRDAYGCCGIKQFDRCLPSLIAFETRSDAEAFRQKHGGTITSLAAIQAGTPTDASPGDKEQ